MVSDIAKFYCQPDMTSSWFLRQGVLHAIFNDRFWKCYHDFLIVFHSNLLSGMHGFRHNEVSMKVWYDVVVISPPRALNEIFHHGFWKSDHDLLMAFLSNFSSGMRGFRDNEVLLQAGYDVIVISPLGGASGDFSWGILKERPWLTDSVPY